MGKSLVPPAEEGTKDTHFKGGRKKAKVEHFCRIPQISQLCSIFGGGGGGGKCAILFLKGNYFYAAS